MCIYSPLPSSRWSSGLVLHWCVDLTQPELLIVYVPKLLCRCLIVFHCEPRCYLLHLADEIIMHFNYIKTMHLLKSRFAYIHKSCVQITLMLMLGLCSIVIITMYYHYITIVEWMYHACPVNWYISHIFRMWSSWSNDLCCVTHQLPLTPHQCVSIFTEGWWWSPSVILPASPLATVPCRCILPEGSCPW